MAILTQSRPFRWWFLAILLTGLALRAAWAIAVPIAPVSDSVVYDQLAWNLASRGAYAWNNGDLTAYWPVGTSFAYSLAFRTVGHSLAAIAALNVITGTVSLGLIMLIARRWLTDAAALVAGAIYAFWPSQIEFTSVLGSEILFNVFLLLSLWVAVATPIRSWIVKGLLAGVFLAAASYVRPTALPLVLLLVAALLTNERADWLGIARFGAAALFAMGLCIGPWTLRNSRELGAPVLISTNGPANTWMGNNPGSTGAYMPLPDDVAGLSEVERSKILAERTKRFVMDHPARAAALFLRKLVITHERETIGVSWNEPSLRVALGNRGLLVAKTVSTAYWLVVLAFGLAGVAILLTRDRWRALVHPALLAWAYFALVHGATVGADRYHFPSIPFIAMLAGFALTNDLIVGFVPPLRSSHSRRRALTERSAGYAPPGARSRS